MAQLNADSTTFILNGTAITDMVEGDFLEINAVNPLTAHTNGANGLLNVNKRVDADVRDVVFRVLRFSESDVFVNNELNQETPTLFNGSAKEAFTRDGNNFEENWILQNGTFTTQPSEVKNNQDGNNIIEYTIRFRTAQRVV